VVVAYERAEDALDDLLRNRGSAVPYDLLITDIQMPGMRGNELIRRLRESDALPPTLVMTAHGDKELLVELLQTGCVDFLDKPVAPGVLVERVNTHLKVRAREKEDRARIDSLVELGSITREVAHDLNNVLCAAANMSRALTLKAGDAAARPLRVLSDATGAAVEMVRELRAYGVNGDPEPLDISREVSRLRQLLATALTGRHRLVLDLADGPPAVTMARTSLSRILLNLLVNARDAMASPGTVTITTSVQSPGICSRSGLPGGNQRGCVLLSVTDSGQGIDTAILERIFEDGFTTKSNGTGSGLTVVRRLVEESGGNVAARVAPARGTTFDIRLPVSGAAPGGAQDGARG
jgi:signal transduction histidine kinase